VRVMDFGLARLRADDDGGTPPPARTSDLQLDSKSPLSADLTVAGHVVGTPAYMAPEIYDGHAADARGDQFAFGVTLFESLFRARPFDKAELVASRSAPPKPKIPADARVPAHLERIALRAISIDPAQRYPSMDALLADLSRDPMARRRRALAIAGGAAVLAAAVTVTMTLVGARARPCEGIDAKLTGVWDPATKNAVKNAFAATKLAFAPQAYADLATALDAYTHEWVATSVDSCKATRVRGEQTEEVQTLRQICLDQRMQGITALVSVLKDPTKPLVEKGGKAVQGLDPIAACSNVAALRQQDAPSPTMLPKVNALQQKLAEANAQMIAGNMIGAGASATAASRLADEIDFMPAKAQADLMRGLIMMAVQNLDEATKLLTEGALAAIEGKRDELAAFAAYTLAGIHAQGLGKFPEAKLWLALGTAEQKRYGGDSGNLEIVSLQISGVVAGLTGDPEAALAAHEHGFLAAQRRLGAENTVTWEAEEDFAASLSGMREDEPAARHFEHAIALRSSVVGNDHPDIGLMLSNLGACYTHIHDPRAKATLERAIAIREKAYGKGSPIMVPTLQNLAENLRWSGDLPGALAAAERGMKQSANMPGKQHPLYQDVATDYATTLTRLGRFDEARALLDEAIKLETDAKSTRLLPVTEAARGELALAEHAWEDAKNHAQRSLAAYDDAGGSTNPALWWPLAVLGRAELELGHADAARAALKRSVAIADRLHLLDPEMEPARAALAKLP